MIRKDDKRQIWSWAMYDFANSAFTTIVVSFIYGTYFTKSIAPNEILGTQWWSWAVSLTAIVVAFLSPFLGALSDLGTYRRRIMWYSTLGCVIATAILFFPSEGQVFFALSVFIVANISFEIGTVFCNAYLADIVSKENFGKTSGFAWGLGYVGGLMALILALFLFVQTNQPIVGLEVANGENIRATNWLVAIWFFVFSIPFFSVIKDVQSTMTPTSLVVLFRDSMVRLRTTLSTVGKYGAISRFLLARLVYNDALVTIFTFGGIYAATTVGFSFEEIIILGIVLNLLAGTGAFIFGYLEDRVGSLVVIKWSLVFLTIACVIAILSPELPGLLQLVFGGDAVPQWFTSKFLFWIAALFIGLFSGPNQSSSRSLMSALTPKEKQNEFFGFYAFSGKATAFVGPLLFGWATAFFNTQQAGLFVIVALFILGYLLLKKV